MDNRSTDDKPAPPAALAYIDIRTDGIWKENMDLMYKRVLQQPVGVG